MNNHHARLESDFDTPPIDAPAVEFEWLEEETSDEDGPADDHYGAIMLRKNTGVAYSTSMFLRMQASGHGPLAAGADLRREAIFMQWHNGVFGQQGDWARTPLVGRSPAALAASERPMWMLASNPGPDTEFVEDHLLAWGANVLIVETPLDAARIASSHNGLAGAVLELGNVQADFVTAYILMQRDIGFLIVADRGERPAGMALGGAIIHNPRSDRKSVV